MSQASPGPMSVGNVVSAAIVLYRSNLKLYLGLAFKAFLWCFIPVYGWAKTAMIRGQIARHAFSQLIDKPETASSIYQLLNPRMWDFLGAGFFVWILLIGINFGISFAMAIPLSAIALIFGSSSAATTSLQFVIQLIASIAQLWFQARYFVPLMPLVAEENVEPSATINRSWDLTKGSGWRILAILFVMYLILLPLWAIAVVPLVFLAIPFTAGTQSPEAILSFMGLFFVLVLLVAGFIGIFAMPLELTIKAVVYYDLRSRREGLGLQLRDRRPI